MSEKPSSVLAIIGSGETSPTMVTLHKDLIAGLGPRPDAVALETPYGFEEGVDQVSAKATSYFAQNVGLRITFAPGLRAPMGEMRSLDRSIAEIRGADWLFAGPGSPTYAIAHWTGTGVAGALRDRLTARRGVTVFASAAACTLGRLTLPVYEIYKAGAAPHWQPGLDLLGCLGLSAVVIPHYNNAEGGSYDTRYCYLGERRLRIMESELPERTPIVGVDEHTALIFDLDRELVEVRGRGVVTVRRAGDSQVLPERRLTAGEFRAIVTGATRLAAAHLPVPAGEGAPAAEPAGLLAAMRDCERRFDAAAAAGDPGRLVDAVLDAEQALSDWGTDTDIDEAEQARGIFRGLLVRIGDLAVDGVRDPRPRAARYVEPLLAVRRRLRDAGQYGDADVIRDVLGELGIGVQDTRDGCRWEPV